MASRVVITCDICGKDILDTAKCATNIKVWENWNLVNEKRLNSVDACSQGCAINWLSKKLGTGLDVNQVMIITKLDVGK